MQYIHVSTQDGSAVTVFVPGHSPLVAADSHPNFDEILDRVADGDESVIDLFDIAQTAAKKFDRLSDRVSVAHGRLYLDGEEVHNSLADQVVRFLNEGVEDWKPLVRFFENVQMNPSAYSREQLFDWIQANREHGDHGLTITPDGLIVGYKGVAKSDAGAFSSISSGTATVDGVVHHGRIPNHIGAVVEMPRSEVTFDPGVGCSFGLHVGTWNYAKNFSKGAVLEVHVHPRDVVSVPTECAAQKMRVCRYKVVRVIDTPYTNAVLPEDSYDPWEFSWEEDLCDECGEYLDHCKCEPW